MKKLLILAFALAIATSAFAAPGKTKASYSGIIEKYDAANEDADHQAWRQAGRVRDHRHV